MQSKMPLEDLDQTSFGVAFLMEDQYVIVKIDLFHFL